MNERPQLISSPASGVHGTTPAACDAFSAMSSAADTYFSAVRGCTVKNCALLRKPSDSDSAGNSAVALATTLEKSGTAANRSFTELRYSALLRRRSGAEPERGVVHADVAPPLGDPPLDDPPLDDPAPRPLPEPAAARPAVPALPSAGAFSGP